MLQFFHQSTRYYLLVIHINHQLCDNSIKAYILNETTEGQHY